MSWPPRDRQAGYVGHLGHGQTRTQRERIPLGHDRDLTLRRHLLAVELAEHVVGAVHQRGVRATLAEHLPLLADLAQQHFYRQCAGPSRVAVEQVTQELMRGAGLGHEDQPVVRVDRPPRPLDGGRRRVEHVSRLLEQRLAGFRHPHAATITAQQLDAQALLEPLDRTGQRRLAYPESFCGTPEVELLSHRGEVAQLPDLDVLHATNLPI